MTSLAAAAGAILHEPLNLESCAPFLLLFARKVGSRSIPHLPDIINTYAGQYSNCYLPGAAWTLLIPVLSTSSELVGDTAGMVGGSSPRSSSEVREGNRSSSDSVLEAEGNRWARLQPE